VGSPALRPNALRPPSILPQSEWRRAASLSFRDERMDESSQTEAGTPSEPANLRAQFTTTEAMPAEISFSQTSTPPCAATDDGSAVASHQDQTTPTQISKAVTAEVLPEPRTQMIRNSQLPRFEILPSATTSPQRQAPVSAQPSTTRQAFDPVADSADSSLATAIERVRTAINTDANEMVPHPSPAVMPTRTDSLKSRQTLPSSASQRSAAPSSPPPVEVKIGSVEIVFDPPPATNQLAPVRPIGFAEFADLRRYAARPWSSTRR
jgi:hypothetical protein